MSIDRMSFMAALDEIEDTDGIFDVNDLYQAVLALVQPDPRIAALEALCETEAERFGYVRTEQLRAVLRGGQ